MSKRALLLVAASACATSQTSSGVPQAIIAERMAELGAELSACLEVTREPVGGTIHLTGMIEQDGSTSMVRVASSTVADANIEGCVTGVVRRNRFPAPRGEPFADAEFTVDVSALDRGPTSEATGTLGATEVNAVLSTHQNTLASCLAMAQASGRAVSGTLELQWRVDEDGRVAWARVARASAPDVEVERCLVSSMMTILFPPPEAGAVDLAIPLKLL